MNYVELARKDLKRLVIEDHTRHYLDLGPEANEVFGEKNGADGTPHGLYGGEVIEIRGEGSAGKSSLAANIAGIGAAQGAIVTWLDLENSWHKPYMEQRGLFEDGINLIRPYLGLDEVVGDNGRRLSQQQISAAWKDPVKRIKLLKSANFPAAETLVEELDKVVKMIHDDHPERLQIVVVDSAAAMITQEVMNTPPDEINMRTKMALTSFLGPVLLKWTQGAHGMNAIYIILNQIREKPGGIGDPRYSPGGKPMIFYPHVRIHLQRIGKPELLYGEPHAIGGYAKAFKNKAGGKEGAKVNYRMYLNDNRKFEFYKSDKEEG